MTINKNDNLDSDKNSQDETLDRNYRIGLFLLLPAFYFTNILVFMEVSQEVQGFLVVIIGLLLIVGIDFFKKDSNASPYPNGGPAHYSSTETFDKMAKNIEEIAAEIKQIIKKVSQKNANSNFKERETIDVEFIEEIKHDRPDETKDLTDQEISTAAETIKIIEQDKPLKQRIIHVLKAGQGEAFLQSLNDLPFEEVLIATMKSWNEDYNDVKNSDTKHQNSDD